MEPAVDVRLVPGPVWETLDVEARKVPVDFEELKFPATYFIIIMLVSLYRYSVQVLRKVKSLILSLERLEHLV